MDLESILVVRTMTVNEVKRKSLLNITGMQNIDNLLPYIKDKMVRIYYGEQVFDLKAAEVKTK